MVVSLPFLWFFFPAASSLGLFVGRKVTQQPCHIHHFADAQHKAVSAWNQQYQCAQNSEFTKDDLISQLDLSIDDESLEVVASLHTSVSLVFRAYSSIRYDACAF